MYKCYSIQNELDKRMALKGFTNSTLATHLNITYQYLSSIRNRKVNASPKLAKRIADALGVEIEDIFEFDKKEK
ncbi:helix-turn-helix transcriptional regulator [Macrococcus caseolyticus]|uniref:helix-turn-helix transcriptional regulator n=1 Tax=Macrococcoides caseolyticum TaxID=69966 RepID=UPI0024BCFEC5|nr:helix-turn-helix transcriptional regulator [Macrococcus caseolyticus]MDJ1153039.1 helix-turn-helix transcriptional regulator [Macrococcus caseolyticus]